MIYLFIFSIEIIIIFIFGLLFKLRPTMFDFTYDLIFSNNGLNWSIVSILNFAPLIGAYKLGKQALFPQDNNKILLNWRLYKVFKVAVVSVLLFSLLSAAVPLIFYLFKFNIDKSLMSYIYISITVIALLGIGSLTLASFKIREILEKYQ